MTSEKKRGRIVFVINAVNLGGAGKMLRYVAGICADRYARVLVLSMFDEEGAVQTEGCVECAGLGLRPTKNPLWRLRAIGRIRAQLRMEKPDLVCAFLSDVAVTTRIAALGMRCKMASAERGDPGTIGTLWRALTVWAYRKSDACIFQLESVRKFFPEAVQKRSVVIPNPYLRAETAAPYMGERKKTIVSIGRFVHQKGYDVLIRAFAAMHASHPEYALLLYGDGPDLEMYKREISELGIEGAVRFPGYVRNPGERIREDGIFVLSSRFEGMPNALIEAMAVGIPTISTRCSPGGPEYLTHNGQRGLLVPVDDAQEMAKAMLVLIEDRALAREIGERGLEIIPILDEKAIRGMWYNVFDALIAQPFPAVSGKKQ